MLRYLSSKSYATAFLSKMACNSEAIYMTYKAHLVQLLMYAETCCGKKVIALEDNVTLLPDET
jgi:hypothetical protein